MAVGGWLDTAVGCACLVPVVQAAACCMQRPLHCRVRHARMPTPSPQNVTSHPHALPGCPTDAPPDAWVRALRLPPSSPVFSEAGVSGGASTGGLSAAASPSSPSAAASGSGSSSALSFVLLADPSFLRIDDLLAGLDYAFPGAPKIGEGQGRARRLCTWVVGCGRQL